MGVGTQWRWGHNGDGSTVKMSMGTQWGQEWGHSGDRDGDTVGMGTQWRWEMYGAAPPPCILLSSPYFPPPPPPALLLAFTFLFLLGQPTTHCLPLTPHGIILLTNTRKDKHTQGLLWGGVGQSLFPALPLPPPLCRSRCRSCWDGLSERGDPTHQQHEGCDPELPQVTPSRGAGGGLWWWGAPAFKGEWSCCTVVRSPPTHRVGGAIKTPIRNSYFLYRRIGARGGRPLWTTVVVLRVEGGARCWWSFGWSGKWWSLHPREMVGPPSQGRDGVSISEKWENLHPIKVLEPQPQENGRTSISGKRWSLPAREMVEPPLHRSSKASISGKWFGLPPGEVVKSP